MVDVCSDYIRLLLGIKISLSNAKIMASSTSKIILVDLFDSRPKK